MSSFFELVKFEYKKILRKKINIITLFLGIILTIVSAVGTLLGNYYIDGKVFESNYEGMKKDREYSRNLSGREINSDLFSETIEAYSKIPFFEGRYTDTEEYQKYARQYSEIYHIIRRVYNINNMREISSIKKESLNNFYTIRQNLVEKAIDNTYMTEKEKVSSINLSRKVNIPFIYSYTGGYNRFFATMYPVAFLICFICTICISPLFAGEYSERMDSLIFSSKYGKSKMIWAKIFTGISFTVLICIVFTIVSYLTVMIFLDGMVLILQYNFYFHYQ